MSYGLSPYGPTHLPRAMQQALEHQDRAALARARKIQGICMVSEVGLAAVARISLVQSQLEQVAPGSALRLAQVADIASGVIATEIIRMGW